MKTDWPLKLLRTCLVHKKVPTCSLHFSGNPILGFFSASKQLNFCSVAYLFITLFVNSFTSVNQCRRAAKQASVSKVSGCSPDRILLGSSLWFTLAQKPEVLR